MEGFAEKRIKKEEGENEFREGEVTTEDGEQRQEKKRRREMTKTVKGGVLKELGSFRKFESKIVGRKRVRRELTLE